MYLAGILGLCALLHVPAYGGVRGEFSSSGTASTYAFLQEPSQSPAPQNPPADSPANQPKPDAAPQQQETPAPETQAVPPAPPATNQDQTAKPAVKPAKPKAGASTRKSTAKKSHTAPAAGEEPQKRVIHRGGTIEPTTRLGPSITDEQAAKQRQTTKELLASTDASLQKLSERQLTKDEQATVAQIRQFMHKAKDANAAGDLPRAYKLAVKARLLSDALAKP